MCYKAFIKSAFFLLAFCGTVFAAENRQIAPDFTLKDLNGTPVTLSSLKGSIVFVDFWATWCPPCRKSIPAVEKMYEKYGGKGVRFLGINVENDPQAVKSFVSSKNIRYTILAESGNVEREYTVQGIPAFFLINAQGEISKRYTGYYPGMEKEWEQEIDALLSALPAQKALPASKKTLKN